MVATRGDGSVSRHSSKWVEDRSTIINHDLSADQDLTWLMLADSLHGIKVFFRRLQGWFETEITILDDIARIVGKGIIKVVQRSATHRVPKSNLGDLCQDFTRHNPRTCLIGSVIISGLHLADDQIIILPSMILRASWVQIWCAAHIHVCDFFSALATGRLCHTHSFNLVASNHEDAIMSGYSFKIMSQFR